MTQLAEGGNQSVRKLRYVKPPARFAVADGEVNVTQPCGVIADQCARKLRPNRVTVAPQA